MKGYLPTNSQHIAFNSRDRAAHANMSESYLEQMEGAFHTQFMPSVEAMLSLYPVTVFAIFNRMVNAP